MGALMAPSEWNTDSLGNIPASIELKLVSIPDSTYLASNMPPQGEIRIRGASVMQEYWQNESASA